MFILGLCSMIVDDLMLLILEKTPNLSDQPTIMWDSGTALLNYSKALLWTKLENLVNMVLLICLKPSEDIQLMHIPFWNNCVFQFFFKFFVSWYFEISNASAINYIINLPRIYVSILEMYGAVRKMSRKRKKKKRFAVLQALKKIGPRVEVTTA
jgi:hypothetical protein